MNSEMLNHRDDVIEEFKTFEVPGFNDDDLLDPGEYSVLTVEDTQEPTELLAELVRLNPTLNVEQIGEDTIIHDLSLALVFIRLNDGGADYQATWDAMLAMQRKVTSLLI